MKKKKHAENSGKNSAIKRKPPESIAPYCFKPGQSGNPGGRPKKPLTDLLEWQLVQQVPGDKFGRSYMQLLIESAVKRAVKKSDILVKEIFDRIEGKVATPEPEKANTGVRVILVDRIPRPDRTAFLAQGDQTQSPSLPRQTNRPDVEATHK